MTAFDFGDHLLERTEDSPRLYDSVGGRQIAFDVRGDPEGRPCFWFHGSPSCRLEAVLLDDFGRREGIRFIATDRPGIGRSSPAADWSMTGFAVEVVTLADHLGLDRFSVAGGSGGGPFVLAMAAVVPDRIDRAVSLACAGAFEIEALRDRIGWVDRVAAWAVPIPGLVSGYFGALSMAARLPEVVARTAVSPFASRLPGGDPRLVTVFQRTLKEATRQGWAGITEDTEVLHRPWGFDLSSIQVSIDFVNGTADEFVPFAYGAELAERIEGSRLHTAIGADHFGTIFDLDRLRGLLSARTA